MVGTRPTMTIFYEAGDRVAAPNIAFTGQHWPEADHDDLV
jgi:hypothetical protein